MLIFHISTINSLKMILQSKHLKSTSLLIKENIKPLLNYGEGLYNENKFIYFGCINELFKKKILYGKDDIVLYFNSKILYNRKFYVSNYFTPTPNKLNEQYINKKKIYYSRKYNRYYENYEKILEELFNTSIKYKSSFQLYQQIAIENKINLKNLIEIEFKKKPTKSLFDCIIKFYPNVKITIKNN
jgi:hypothetical protein